MASTMTPGLTLQWGNDGKFSFTNAAGEPASFSGHLTFGTATLTLAAVEKIQLGGW